jgi:predicted nucleic acid-binding protein
VLDTNVVLDWLAFDDAAMRPVAAAIAAGGVRLVSSAACVEELQRALGYKAVRLDAAAQAQVLEAYRRQSILVDAPVAGALPVLPRCEDPDDQKFLELAWYAGARWLVTRDKALLKLAAKMQKLAGPEVIPPGEFNFPP